MTISYTLQVATCTGLGCFWKLLFRWKGSIWKLLWLNVIAFVLMVGAITVLRIYVLSEAHQLNFEKVAKRMKRDKDMIPMAFILGFYVNLVITRWWSQYVKMPWPDGMAVYISTLIYGQDDRGRLIRRTLIRYCNLALVLTMRLFSTRLKRRFASYDHLVDAGLLQMSEKHVMEHMDLKTKHPKYWMPLVWAGSILVKARKEGRVRDDFSMKTLVDALNKFRGECGGMIDYDWICIPLVYTQVVTLAVYAFIVTSIISSQAPMTEESHAYYVPVFSFMKLFFYMGWLKVAETLVNPWGDDDDDFEVNWMVDRHLQVSYMIVDDMHQDHPEMLKDQYWDEVFPSELPYTHASKPYNYIPSSSFNLVMDDLMTHTVEVDDESIDSEEGGYELKEDYTAQSSLAKSMSKDANIKSFHSRKHTKKKKKKKYKTSRTVQPSDSRMLYQASTSSLSSLTTVDPLTEDSMGYSSEDSIDKPQIKSGPEHMEDEAVEEELRIETNLLRQHSPVASSEEEYVTDLVPVDLSVPDSKTSLPPKSEPWRKLSSDTSYTGSWRNSAISNDRREVSVGSFSRINVVSPTTESGGAAFPPDLIETFSFDEPSPSTAENRDQDSSGDPDDQMVTILPSSAGIDNVASIVYLKATPTSSGSSTTPTTTLVTTISMTETTTTTSQASTNSVSSSRVIDVDTGPEVTIMIDDLEEESVPPPSADHVRPGWRGFQTLEPITEQTEPTSEDKMDVPKKKDKPKKKDEPKKSPDTDKDGAGPSTSSS